MSRRHALLAVLLLGALAAAFWPAKETGDGDEVVEAVIKPRAAKSVPAVPDAMQLPGMREGRAQTTRFATGNALDMFPAQSFRAPPKPVKPAPLPPPPPPMAPPLPFSFIGIWTENGREQVFLEHGGQVITARVGDTLPGGWRLDAISPETLSFTYVSLNQPRTLRIAP